TGSTTGTGVSSRDARWCSSTPTTYASSASTTAPWSTWSASGTTANAGPRAIEWWPTRRRVAAPRRTTPRPTCWCRWITRPRSATRRRPSRSSCDWSAHDRVERGLEDVRAFEPLPGASPPRLEPEPVHRARRPATSEPPTRTWNSPFIQGRAGFEPVEQRPHAERGTALDELAGGGVGPAGTGDVE